MFKRWFGAKNEPTLDEASPKTPVPTVTCRDCGRVARSSVAREAGWMLFESFDGTDAICPTCLQS